MPKKVRTAKTAPSLKTDGTVVGRDEHKMEYSVRIRTREHHVGEKPTLIPEYRYCRGFVGGCCRSYYNSGTPFQILTSSGNWEDVGAHMGAH